MVAKMTKGGLFSYLRAYLTHITPYKLFIRLFFVEKQKLVVHPHKNVQRVFFIYIGSFDTPSTLSGYIEAQGLFSEPSATSTSLIIGITGKPADANKPSALSPEGTTVSAVITCYK